MQQKTLSIRPFIGAKNYELCRNFYRDLGFEEVVIGSNMSLFKSGELGFYLQDYYLKDWIDNTMVFMEVEDVNKFYDELLSLNLPGKYPTAKLIPVRVEPWGSECFLHDPSGVLWHFGAFAK